jgi:hypothetical protein
MKYRVNATMTTDLYVIVEADSEDEALEIARNMDGGEFIEDERWGSGDWNIEDAAPVECDK